jgi:hypothetical protein
MSIWMLPTSRLTAWRAAGSLEAPCLPVGVEDALLVLAVGVLELLQSGLELRERHHLGRDLRVGLLLQLLFELAQALLDALLALGTAGMTLGRPHRPDARWK